MSTWSDLGRPPLRAAALRAALVAPGPLARLEVLGAVGSTNAELLRLAAADPAAWPHLSALTTDSQTSGRGRLGRTWTAPPRSGVAVSVLLRLGGDGDATAPAVPQQRWSWLPLLAGLAVTSAVRDVAGLPATLKWPNDVLVEGRKLSGLLTEVGAGGAVVVGIGVNVSTTAAELAELPPAAGPAGSPPASGLPGSPPASGLPGSPPASGSLTATSLAVEGATTTDRDTVLRAVVRSLATEVHAWVAAGGDAVAGGLADRVAQACGTLGEQVRVSLPDGSVLTGVAHGLDDDGRLVVRPDGWREGQDAVVVGAGDVVHVR